VNCHLVSIKISIESSTYHRVQLDSAAVNQYRLECLNTQSMKSRRTVQQYKPVFDDLLKYVIHFRSGSFHEPPGAFYIMGNASFQ